MALRPIRIDRTSKPPLGTPLRSDGHWSVQGLVGAWAFNEAAGGAIFSNTGTPSTTEYGSFSWLADGIKCATAAINLNTVAPNGALSFVTRLKHAVAAQDMPLFLAQGTYPRLRIRVSENATNNFLYQVSGDNYRYFNAPIGAFDVPATWGVVIPGESASDTNNIKAYLNGTSLPAGTTGAGPTISPRGVMSLGRYAVSYTNAQYEFHAVFSRALSAPEVASLSANPWQIYEPETVWFATTEGGTSGSFTIPAATLQPIVSAPTLAGAQAGSFTIPAVSLQPQVAAPALAGAQTGSFTIPAVTLQPSVAAPTLTGVQAGSFAIPTVTLQPVVAAPSLTGAQAGSFAIPSVTLQPVVAAPVLTGAAASTGSFTIQSVTLQPIVTAPSLAAASANSIRAPNGTVMDLRDISGNILNLRFMA